MESEIVPLKERTKHYDPIEQLKARQEDIFNDIDPETLEKMCVAAEESWEEYKRTGLHLTSNEITAWIKRLRSNPKEQIPACHK